MSAYLLPAARQTVLTAILLACGTFPLITHLIPMKTSTQKSTSPRPWKTLYLCLVTRGTNSETVLRSTTSMTPLLQLDSHLRFIILSDGNATFPTNGKIEQINVPSIFNPPHALYKARALEYFRQTLELSDEDWILHLDEETLVDEHCIHTCIRFIENTNFQFGQWVILYNTVNYYTNYLLTFAEIFRFKDDLGRVQTQHGHVHKTIFGCHGSFLVMSGLVENEVTWDTECIAEDFWFADQANRKGYGSGFIPSTAREQANYTYMDFLRQRRRWLRGMWTVNGPYGKLMVGLWVVSTFEVPMAVLFWTGILKVEMWCAVWMQVYFGCSLFTILFATLLSDLDAGVASWRIGWHLCCTPVMSIAVQVLQTVTVVYSIVTRARGFHIVVKG